MATILVVINTYGQPIPELRAGIVIGAATLRADALPCCPLASTGLLTSLAVGAGLNFELTKSLSLFTQLDIRGTWRSASTSELTTILHPSTEPPSTIPARFEHTVNISSLAPGIEVGSSLTVHTFEIRSGISSRLYSLPTSSIRTVLISDNSNAIVINGFVGEQRWKTQTVDGLVWSVWSDVRIPLPSILGNHRINLVAGAEVPVIDSRQYLMMNGIQFRLGISYEWPTTTSHLLPSEIEAPRQSPDVPFVTDIPDFSYDLPDLTIPRGLRLVALQGRHPDTLFVETEETETNDHLPVLPVLFFDEGSSTIPSRFTSAISSWETREGDVDVATAARAGLAIIARRLRDDSSGVLRIVGTTSSYGADTGQRLAYERAFSVRDELIRLGVPQERLIVETTPTPRHPTIAADPLDAPFAREENQRVDLIAPDDVFEPVLVRRVINESAHGMLAALLEQNHSHQRTTGLTLQTSSALLRERKDTVNLPHDIRFPVDVFHSLPQGIHTVVGITWEGGTRGSTDSVTVVRHHQKRIHREIAGGHVIDRVRLIVFSYDETVIRGANLRRIKNLRSEISSTDSIRIIGRTDNIGAAAYNVEISRRRARETARALGTQHAEIIASGEGDSVEVGGRMYGGRNDVNPLTGRFSDRTPEGRMYNRTVLIERIVR